MTTAPTTFDITAARNRRFDGGMGAHGNDDEIIAERRRFIARHPNPERFCPRCTAHRGAGACHPCTIEGGQ